jgi:prepilin-type N-terminal cleavage/methylation domain-containing protein
MLKKTVQRGFTIVELLIVIVVIGILAALVLNTFSGVQRRARDTERQTDVNSVATQLEVYFNDKGQYPTLANLQSDAWATANLKGIDPNALKAPNRTANSITNQTTTAGLGGRAANSQYGYVPVNSAGAACDNTAGNECVKFTLYWVKEDAADDASATQTKASLN